MGRMIRVDDDPIINPALPISLMVAGMAATLAIITGLCGFGRKTSTPFGDKADVDIATSENEAKDKTEDKTEEVIKELPLPPGMRALRESYSSNNLMQMPKSASTRKLNFTFSVKHSRSISMSKIKEIGKIKDMSKIKEKVIKPKQVDQDSLWKKTIILGGKCKLSDDKDQDQDGESVFQNGVTFRVASYHPRTMSTISLSRTTSFRESDMTPDEQEEKGMTRKEEEDS